MFLGEKTFIRSKLKDKLQEERKVSEMHKRMMNKDNDDCGYM